MRVAEYIKNYKAPCYCEILIKLNGSIELAQPSHIMKLVELSGETYDEIYAKMPINASPIHWLVDYTNIVAVWYDFYICNKKITEKQKHTIERLKSAGCIYRDSTYQETNEIELCK